MYYAYKKVYKNKEIVSFRQFPVYFFLHQIGGLVFVGHFIFFREKKESSFIRKKKSNSIVKQHGGLLLAEIYMGSHLFEDFFFLCKETSLNSLI